MDWVNHPAYTRAQEGVIKLFKRRVFLFKHVRPAVFLCGKRKSSNRNLLRDYFAKQHPHLLVFYAENVWDHIAGREGANALKMEDELARFADIVIILVESPGTFTELGAFSLNDYLRVKLLPILDRSYQGEASFINTGPIALINKDSRYREAIFADFRTLLRSADEIDRRLEKIPRQGRLPGVEAVKNPHEKPKHLLSLLCDLVAVIGPAPEAHCQRLLEKIVGQKPVWDVASLLGLAVSLGFVMEDDHEKYGRLYFRPLWKRV